MDPVCKLNLTSETNFNMALAYGGMFYIPIPHLIPENMMKRKKNEATC